MPTEAASRADLLIALFSFPPRLYKHARLSIKGREKPKGREKKTAYLRAGASARRLFFLGGPCSLSSLALESSNALTCSLRLRGTFIVASLSCNTWILLPPPELTPPRAVVSGGGPGSGTTLRWRPIAFSTWSGASSAGPAPRVFLGLDLDFVGGGGAFSLPSLRFLRVLVAGRTRFVCFFARGSSDSESLPSNSCSAGGSTGSLVDSTVMPALLWASCFSRLCCSSSRTTGDLIVGVAPQKGSRSE